MSLKQSLKKKRLEAELEATRKRRELMEKRNDPPTFSEGKVQQSGTGYGGQPIVPHRPKENGSSQGGGYEKVSLGRAVKVLYRHDTGLTYVIRISQNVKPLEEDYLVRLHGNRIATVEKMDMHSSTVYTVFFGQSKLCGCKGFVMSGDKKTCRHIEAMLGLMEG